MFSLGDYTVHAECDSSDRLTMFSMSLWYKNNRKMDKCVFIADRIHEMDSAGVLQFCSVLESLHSVDIITASD